MLSLHNVFIFNCRYLVSCEPHEGRHTGILVAKKLDEIIDTLELPEISKALTTDNASNMKVAGKESAHIEKHIGCVDHSLNLVVNAGLKSVKEIQSAVENFKKLVTSSHKSSLYCETIKRFCGNLNDSGVPVNYTKMIQPVETRWNSTLMMIRSVTQLRLALEAIKDSTHKSTDSRLQALIPEAEDFELMEAITPILTKFEAVSESLSGETYPTICLVILKLFFLQTSLVKEVQANRGVLIRYDRFR